MCNADKLAELYNYRRYLSENQGGELVSGKEIP